MTTDNIFKGEWSDPIYFGEETSVSSGLSNPEIASDSLGYDADLFFDQNGDVRPYRFPVASLCVLNRSVRCTIRGAALTTRWTKYTVSNALPP